MFPSEPESIVDVALRGLAYTSGKVPLKFVGPSDLSLSHRAILTPSVSPKRTVQIISGGGSGHEPFAAGLLGNGFLSGCACGEVFASPAVKVCEAAIEGVYGLPNTSSVLCVILNYTGDVVNFGAAAANVSSNGRIPCRVLAVGDDKAELPISSHVGPRGLAGILFVLKILCAAADEGRDIEYLWALGENLKTRLGTMGTTHQACALPRKLEPVRKIRGCEIGLGIHGEPGTIVREERMSCDEAARVLVSRVVESLGLAKGSTCALLLNSLGGLSQLELLCLTKSTIEYLHRIEINVIRVIRATLMTSLDAKGASVTLLSLEGDDLRRLDADADCCGGDLWQCHQPRMENPFQRPMEQISSSRIKRVKTEDDSDEIMLTLISDGLRACADRKNELNALDAKGGDGDLGESIKQVFLSFERLSKSRTNETWDQILRRNLDSVGGSLVGLVRAFVSAKFDVPSDRLATSINAVLGSGSKTTTQSSTEPHSSGLNNRSFLDALIPAVLAGRSIRAGALAAREGANRTKEMVAKVGRASYVPFERYKGSNDAGAEAIALFFEGASIAHGDAFWPE